MIPSLDLHRARAFVGFFCFLCAADVSADTVQISSDPFTNSSSQHMTEVEPQIYANGSTIVATFQQGRIFGGGAADIGFATSTDSGATWQEGSLPGLTIWAGGDRYESVTDTSLAYNAAFGLWLVESMPVGFGNREIFVSRSGDGLSWDNPITVYSTSSGSFDKPWITCDNTPTSPFFGNCYIEWDDVADGDRILMSTSSDGGNTWSAPLTTADAAGGLGGQPLVQPSGRVVVPYTTFPGIRAFISDDGGNSWGASFNVTNTNEHPIAGGLRDFNLPSAAIDGDGRIYVVWTDCRFRTSCRSNDIAISSSANGLDWSAPARVPIDQTTSNADHFLPGLGADRNSFGPNVGLALVYYYYPQVNCTSSTCQLSAAFITSQDGGASWSNPMDVAGPMSIDWLPDTISGRMVGDYFSVFYTDDGAPHPVFASADAPAEGMFFESMFSTCVGCAPPAAARQKMASCVGATCPSTSGDEPVAEEWQMTSAQSPSGALRVSADATRINIGAVLPLRADGPAIQNAPVDWVVEEGASGGSVSSSGVYTAPLSPGVYHLIASSRAERARLAIKVFTVQ